MMKIFLVHAQDCSGISINHAQSFCQSSGSKITYTLLRNDAILHPASTWRDIRHIVYIGYKDLEFLAPKVEATFDVITYWVPNGCTVRARSGWGKWSPKRPVPSSNHTTRSLLFRFLRTLDDGLQNTASSVHTEVGLHVPVRVPWMYSKHFNTFSSPIDELAPWTVILDHDSKYNSIRHESCVRLHSESTVKLMKSSLNWITTEAWHSLQLEGYQKLHQCHSGSKYGHFTQ